MSDVVERQYKHVKILQTFENNLFSIAMWGTVFILAVWPLSYYVVFSIVFK